MRRTVLFLATAAVLLLSPAVAVAQDGQPRPGGTMGGPMMMGQGQSMPCGPMHMGMMAAMARPTMLATQDGGVVVLSGDKMMKYDKDLKLVNEVQVKIDTSAGQEMRQNCQQCWKMRRGQGGQMMGPGSGQMMQPGQRSDDGSPGSGQMMQPGSGQMMQPGSGQMMQPGSGQMMQPGSGQTVQPQEQQK